MKELEDRVAVITGAASGIGRGIANAFAKQGMRLVLADVEASPLQQVAEELTAAGAEVITELTDVSDYEQVAALSARAYAAFGVVNVLCNNAGVINDLIPTWESPLEDWDWVLGVNLMGIAHAIRAFVPRMLESGAPGHIVNTASTGGLVAGTTNGIYTASKHAAVALSESIHNEFKTRGAAIDVSVLCPGWVRTGIADADRSRGTVPARSTEAQRIREKFRSGVDSGIDPDDVGAMVVEGIKERRFYILTHPHWNYIIRERFEAILSGGPPPATRLPK